MRRDVFFASDFKSHNHLLFCPSHPLSGCVNGTEAQRKLPWSFTKENRDQEARGMSEARLPKLFENALSEALRSCCLTPTQH